MADKQEKTERTAGVLGPRLQEPSRREPSRVRFGAGTKEADNREPNAPRGRPDESRLGPEGPNQNPNIRVTHRRSDRTDDQDEPLPKRPKRQDSITATRGKVSNPVARERRAQIPEEWPPPTRNPKGPLRTEHPGPPIEGTNRSKSDFQEGGRWAIPRRPKGPGCQGGSRSPSITAKDRKLDEPHPRTWDPKTPHLPEHPGCPIEGTQGPETEFPGKSQEKFPRRSKGAGERGGPTSPSTSALRADPIPQSTNTSTRGTSRTSSKIRVPSPTEPKNSYVGAREREGRALSTPRHRELPSQPAQAKAHDPSDPSPSKFGDLAQWIRRPANLQEEIAGTAIRSGSASRASRASAGAPPSGTPVASAQGLDPDPPRDRGPLTTRHPEPGSPSKRTLAAHARNVTRIQIANAADRDTLGEFPLVGEEKGSARGDPSSPPETQEAQTRAVSHHYLPQLAEAFLPEVVQAPDDTFPTPPWFLRALTEIARAPVTTPSKPPFRFEVSPEAAEHNARLLAEKDFDVGRFLGSHQDTTLGYGCEFRPPAQLEPLLGLHPHFGLLEDLLRNGMSYHYKVELSEAERTEELAAILARGNHKSATAESAQVLLLLTKDVTHGFSVPIPVGSITRILGAAVQPLGMATQMSVDNQGNPKVKFRLTQDLTFSSEPPPAPPRSINGRIQMESYPEMTYGWCLPRTLHFIVSLRWHQPSRRILIGKYDYSDAYRRVAHSGSAAPQTIAVHKGMGYLALRLTFGGSPNPPTWCMVSELVTDLANEICQCEDWNPAELHSPVQPTAPKPVYVADPSTPLAPAMPMAVGIPPTERGKVDGFIDDLIHVFWDTPSNCERLPHAVPLAMHVTSRPHAGDSEEPLPRRDILSIPKLRAEGAPAEVQTVLGWSLNTRTLTISLPETKFRAWLTDLSAITQSRRCTFGAMESLAGRLCHASYAIPLTRHFLDRIEGTIASTTDRKSTPLNLSTEVVNDLLLWHQFLAKAHLGISMNLVVIRRPSRLCWSDACPFGIGGYSLVTGKAWRVRIPTGSIIHGHPGVNNLLEFLGMIVNVWLECRSCQESQNEEHACILALGDNTSAIGWLHKTARLSRNRQAHAAHLFAARHLATVVLRADCCLASQHIRGVHNVVADLLSYVGDARGKPHPIAFDSPPNDVLTHRFHSHYPDQIPEHFEICQLPDDMTSWLSEVMQMAASSLLAARKAATKTATGPGDVGLVSSHPLDTPVTPSSLLYPSRSRTFSPSPSFKPYAPSDGVLRASLTECVRDQWWRTLCGRPQATWVRRFGAIANKAPSTSRSHPTCDPSCVLSCPPTRTLTPPRSDNGPSRQSSCEACSASPAPSCPKAGTPTSPSSANSRSSGSSTPCARARPPPHRHPDERRSLPSVELYSATPTTKWSRTPPRRSPRLNELPSHSAIRRTDPKTTSEPTSAPGTR